MAIGALPIDLRRLPMRLKVLVTGRLTMTVEAARALGRQLEAAIAAGWPSRQEKADMAELLRALEKKLAAERKRAQKAELAAHHGKKLDAQLEVEGRRNWIGGSRKTGWAPPDWAPPAERPAARSAEEQSALQKAIAPISVETYRKQHPESLRDAGDLDEDREVLRRGSRRGGL